MGDDDTHMSIPADLMKNIEWMRAHLTKRREQGNYNATDRFVTIAIVNSHDVARRYRTGTETFDHIWRGAPLHTTHLVLQSGNRWLVTSIFSAKMNDRGIVEMGPYKLFTTEETAIMYATIMASQGKEIMSLDSKHKFRFITSTEGKCVAVKIESDDLTHN